MRIFNTITWNRRSGKLPLFLLLYRFAWGIILLSFTSIVHRLCLTGNVSPGRGYITNSKFTRAEVELTRRLLADAPLVRNPCDLDLLIFLQRHPRIVLTSEQIGVFVGYPMNQVADSLEMFIAAGLLDRTQTTAHAARMYLLKLEGPEDDGLQRLLMTASNYKGRQGIMAVLRSRNPALESRASHRKLRIVKTA